MEQDSQQVISEQLAVHASLHETARLKRGLNEAANVAEASAQSAK
jgi:hypothetical protein